MIITRYGAGKCKGILPGHIKAVQATGDAYVALLHDLDELVNTDTASQARSASVPALVLVCC